MLRTFGHPVVICCNMLDNVGSNLKAWPNGRNISTQHLAPLLHDVVTCVEWAGQRQATFSTQHVDVYVPHGSGAQKVDQVRMP